MRTPSQPKKSCAALRHDAEVLHDFVEGPSEAQLAGGRAAVVMTPVGAVAIFVVAESLYAIDDSCVRC